MSRFCFILLSVLCVGPFGLIARAAVPKQPNVMVILADDLGYSDLGCYGSEINTPNLDRLAAGGLRYSQFYNTARCWPTRAAILTGYYAQQVGRDALPRVPGGARSGRPAWARLLPAMLRPQGYRSYLSGKWHVDGKPMDEGFDHALTMDDHNRFFYPNKVTIDGKPQPPVAKGTDYYQTTAITDHALECLDEHSRDFADRPFFHFVTYTSPHFPLHAPAGDIAKYDGKYARGWDEIRAARYENLMELGLVFGPLSKLEPEIGPPYRHFSNPAVQTLGADKEVDSEVPWDSLSPSQQAFQAAKMEIHAAMIDRMDAEIGRLIAKLESIDALSNTLVLFLSDNGASAEIMIRGDGHDATAPLGSGATYLCLGPGWSSAANTPFRRHKTWTHEGGCSTPLIAHWPDGIRGKGEIRRQVGHVVDIVPTILELAGAEQPKEFRGEAIPQAPGESLVDSFNRSQAMERTIWWLHDGHKALRHGDYKIVASKGESWQLYDMTADRAETNDLSQKLPDTAQDLQARWQSMTDKMEAAAKQRAAQKKQRR